MQVYLDGQLIDASGTTLERAIDSARAKAGTRMLVEALADGKPVPAAHFDHPPGTSPYARELAFASADPAGLLAGVSTDLSGLLNELNQRQQGVAELLQSGQIEKAIAGISEILDSWRVVKEGITVSLQAGANEPGHDARERDLTKTITALAASLNEVRRAMTDQDWAGLGDCLAYDMREHAERCRRWIERAGHEGAKG